jgi:hypothetical protein
MTEQQLEHAARMAKLWGELTGGRYIPSWHTDVIMTFYRVGWKPQKMNFYDKERTI